MTPDEAVEFVGGLADEEDTLMDEERQAIGVLLAERERLRAVEVEHRYFLVVINNAVTLLTRDMPDSAQRILRAALAGKAQP